MSIANLFAFSKFLKISSGGRVMLLSMLWPLSTLSHPAAILEVDIVRIRLRWAAGHTDYSPWHERAGWAPVSIECCSAPLVAWLTWPTWPQLGHVVNKAAWWIVHGPAPPGGKMVLRPLNRKVVVLCPYMKIAKKFKWLSDRVTHNPNIRCDAPGQ